VNKVSVVVPVYNEAPAIAELLRRVCEAELPAGFTKEIVVIDDGSTDYSMRSVRHFIEANPLWAGVIKLHESHINHGKGAAVRAGFEVASGNILIVQDADLEYSPSDYGKLLEPFADPAVQVTYGSRFMKGFPVGMRLPNLIANLILSWTTTLLFGQRLTDEATGYKVFRKHVLDHFELHARGFEFCPEFTANVLKAGFRIHEVPISYNPRGVNKGKKIRTRDGFIAVWWLVKVWLRETLASLRSTRRSETRRT
jgi:dolichol-phosphate mannosyltransferase